jgi:predicted nucleic acid-binding protein
MSPLVVDASAAIAFLTSKPGAPDVERHLHGAMRANDSRLVPTLFWIELINVLAHRYRLAPAEVVEAVYELEQVGLVTTEIGRPGSLAVIDAAGRTGLTAYDAAYLVLAQSTDGRLLTADADLAAAAGDRAVRVDGAHRVGEAIGSYVAEPSWARWRGAAAYLAELRRADAP